MAWLLLFAYFWKQFSFSQDIMYTILYDWHFILIQFPCEFLCFNLLCRFDKGTNKTFFVHFFMPFKDYQQSFLGIIYIYGNDSISINFLKCENCPIELYIFLQKYIPTRYQFQILAYNNADQEKIYILLMKLHIY